MKQIISIELAEELGISTTTAIGQMVACVVEERKVFFRIYTLKDMIAALNTEAMYIGNDRKRLVGWEQERWFLWQKLDDWSLDHHPSNKTLAGLKVIMTPSILDRVKSSPDQYTELSKTEADYILAKPDGEGWELRAPVVGDSVGLVQGEYRVVIDSFSDTQRVTKDTIDGLRWCKKPAVPWTQEDVPALCWLKRKDGGPTRQVIAIYKTSISTHTRTLSYAKLLEKYKWSADLKNWKPCTKESDESN